MAKIYQQQGESSIAQGLNPGTENVQYAKQASKGLMQEGVNQIEKGLSLELQAQTTSSNQDLKNLYSDPNLTADPLKMGQEMDKIAQTYSAALETDEQKIAYLSDYELKKSSYIHQATANLQKVEAERAKSIAYDSVYSDIDAMGVAFGNGVSGVYNEDDIVNFQVSSQNLLNNINSKNSDGTFVFSDAERRKMSTDLENSVLESFKSRFEMLDSGQKEKINQDFANDSYNLIETEDGSINIKDVMGEKNYTKAKEYVSEAKKREVDLEYKRMNLEKRQEQIDRYNIEMSLSAQLDDLDSNEALKLLDESQSKISDKYYKAKQKSILSAKGIDADTQASKYADYLLDISSLNPDSAREFFDKTDILMTQIEESYANGELKLSDKRNLINNLSKRQGKNLPELINEESGWFKGFDYSDANELFTKGLMGQSDINDAMLEYDRTLSQGDYTNKEKKALADTIIGKYRQQEVETAILGDTKEFEQVGEFKVRIK